MRGKNPLPDFTLHAVQQLYHGCITALQADHKRSLPLLPFLLSA